MPPHPHHHLLEQLAPLHAIPDVVDAPLPPISVAMGVLVAPSAHAQRQAVRQTSLKSQCVSKTPAPGRVLMRFVVEERTDALREEQSRHGDIAFISLAAQRGELKWKPLKWLQIALLRWPATLIGKMDADTYIWPCMLLRDLQRSIDADAARDPASAIQTRRGGPLSAPSDWFDHSHDLYYGLQMLWHGCAKRGPPPLTCYAQGGLYILSRGFINWTRTSEGFRKHVRTHSPIGYAFEDAYLGWWLRKYAEERGDELRVYLGGTGSYGDRKARLAALAEGKHEAGPFVHLNLGSGGNMTVEPDQETWCTGVYKDYECCQPPNTKERKLRRHCAALESEQCRMDPSMLTQPRPVTGCLGEFSRKGKEKGRELSRIGRG